MPAVSRPAVSVPLDWKPCGVMAYVCTKCSVYVHVLTLDVCMNGFYVYIFLAINTQSNRTKTTVKVSSEAMAQLVEYSLTM